MIHSLDSRCGETCGDLRAASRAPAGDSFLTRWKLRSHAKMRPARRIKILRGKADTGEDGERPNDQPPIDPVLQDTARFSRPRRIRVVRFLTHRPDGHDPARLA